MKKKLRLFQRTGGSRRFRSGVNMLDAVVSTLNSRKSISQFCTQFTVSLDGFELSIDPNGKIEFPVSEQSARALIRYAQPAKFGLRDKTIYDARVRNVWEIASDRIAIEDSWRSKLDSALLRVKNDLGLPETGKLTAHLHNLLIYEPGQFFIGHQDTEKIDGMIATLVILLPSDFQGGALVVEQQGDKQTLGLCRPGASSDLTLVAFYADCRHEVEEVTSGHRIALTYNLVFEPGSEPIQSKYNSDLVEKLRKYFEVQYVQTIASRSAGHPQWFVYLFDHEYSQRGLSWQSLKGIDRLRAEEFLGAAEELGLTAHLALADVHQSWSTEDTGWHRGRGRRYSRMRYEDDDEEDEMSGVAGENYRLSELIDEDCELRYWQDRSGTQTELKGHSVPRQMTCWTMAVDEFRPFRSDYEPYMGNYGNTLERWYHRAAIVLWKSENNHESFFAIDHNATLRMIKNELVTDPVSGLRAVQKILPFLADVPSVLWNADLIFEVSAAAKDMEIASKLLKSLTLESLSVSSVEGLSQLANAYGEEWCIERLDELIKRQRHDVFIKYFILQVEFFRSSFAFISKWMTAMQLLIIKNFDSRNESSASPSTIKSTQHGRVAIMADLLKAARIIDASTLHREAIDHVLASPRLYPVDVMVDLFSPVAEFLARSESSDWGADFLLQEAKRKLEIEASLKRERGDWSIETKVQCSCDDCKILKLFLQSRITQTTTWPLAKERRAHIHRALDSMDVPVTHVTKHTGSPHKLVLTKTSALFQQTEDRAKAASLQLQKLSKLAKRLAIG